MLELVCKAADIMTADVTLENMHDTFMTSSVLTGGFVSRSISNA